MMFGSFFDLMFGHPMGIPSNFQPNGEVIKTHHPNSPVIVAVNKMYLDAMQRELAKKHPDYVRVAEYADLMIKDKWV